MHTAQKRLEAQAKERRATVAKYKKFREEGKAKREEAALVSLIHQRHARVLLLYMLSP